MSEVDWWKASKEFFIKEKKLIGSVYCEPSNPEPDVRSTFSQWRIQDFPKEGAPTYDFVKISQKLHEIERIWTPRGPSHPLRSVTVSLSSVLFVGECKKIQKQWIFFDFCIVMLRLNLSVSPFLINQWCIQDFPEGDARFICTVCTHRIRWSC